MFPKHLRRNCELLKRKPNKQYHTENQGLKTNFLLIDQFKTRRERLKSAVYFRLKKRKVFQNILRTIVTLSSILQCRKIPERISTRLENFLPQLETTKIPFLVGKNDFFSFGKRLIVRFFSSQKHCKK